jgi:hypothetical protein
MADPLGNMAFSADDISSAVDSNIKTNNDFATQNIKLNIGNALKYDPDYEVELRGISEKLGIPLESVRANRDDTKKQVLLSSPEFNNLADEYPNTAKFFQDQQKALIAHDDVSTLKNIENKANYLGRSLVAGVGTLGAVGTKILESTVGSLFFTSDQEAAVLFKDNPAALKKFRDESAAGTLSRWSRQQTDFAESIIKNAPEEVKAPFKDLEYATLDPNKAAYLSPTKITSDILQSLPSTLAMMASIYFTRGAAGNTYSSLRTSGMSEEVAKAAAVKTAAETMAKYSAVSEGVVGYGQQANQATATALKIDQSVLEQSADYQDLVKNQGYSPEAAKIYLSALAGEKSGTLGGLIDGITSYFGGKFLGKFISEGGAVVPRVAKGFASESVTESIQSSGEQLSENLVLQKLDKRIGAFDNVLESAVQGLVVGGVSGGAFAGIGGRAIKSLEDSQIKVANATMGAQLLGQMNDLAEASKLRARDVSTFQTFMQSATEDSPVDTVFVNPKVLIDTLEKYKVKVEDLGVDGLKESIGSAINSGTDLGIAVSDFATHLAGKDFSQELIPNLKTDPMGMTQAQAQEFMTNHGENLKEEIGRLLEVSMADQPFKESADKVQQQILDQLSQVNRFTPDVNNAYSSMLSNFYSVSAAKLGISPEQMAARYPIQIRAENVATPGTYNQDEGFTLGGEGTYNQAPVIGEGEVKRVLHREPGQFNAQEQVAFDDFLQTRPDAQKILDNLATHRGTPWAKQAVEGIFTRQAMRLLIEGKQPNFQSSMDSGQVKRTRKVLSERGLEGLWGLLEADGGLMGGAAKPVNNVNSSFVNCDPSADCAKYCYATKGNYQYSNVIVKSELVTLAIELDPVRSAKRVASEYKATAEFANNKALRLFDKGDGNMAWIPFIEQLNKDGIRTQIFSKVPEFLRAVPEMNLRLLSIDDSNMAMADANLDLPVAFVYTGKSQIDALAKMAARDQIQVVLPVKLGQRLLDGSEITELKKEVPAVKPYLCPIDSGFKKLGKPSQEGTWNCTKCDINGGIGCFHGNATKAVMGSMDVKPTTNQDRANRILELRRLINDELALQNNADVGAAGSVSQDRTGGLLSEVDTLLGELLRDYVVQGEGKPTLVIGSGTVEESGGTAKPVSNRRVIPIYKLNQSATGSNEGDGTLNQAEGERGSISFGSDITQTPSVITLLQAADLSTFLHESGHFFLEVTADIANRPDAPESVKTDMSTLLNWLGVENMQTWQEMSIEQRRQYHEKFARGFEAYLFEGKSPSLEMRSLFQRFRAWLVNVYKTFGQLNVELTDEVRQVFDRMLASTEQIQMTEDANQYTPLFKNKPDFMTEDEWVAYQKSDIDASQDAVSELETRSLKDMQWLTNAKNKLIKALQKENDEKRQAVRQEVANEVMNEPVYRIMEYLKRGVMDGIPAENPQKISVKALEDMYAGEGDRYALFDWSTLGYGKYGMLSKEGGVHPDLIASLPGSTFTSGDELVRALAKAEPMSEKIARKTDQVMLSRYGDLNSPAAVEKAANEAIHNQARAKFVATEANALAKVTGRPKILAQAAKQFASEMIARLKIRNIKVGQYSAAEIRSAKAAEAARAKGNLIEAATEKRNQLINNYATKAAMDAQQEVDKALRYLKKFDKEATRKNLDIDYLEQIDALLARFDLRQSTTLKAIDKRKSLLEWVQSQQEAGNEPTIPDELLNETLVKSYKDMTLEEFRGLVDAVRNIDHLGRLKKHLLKLQDKREFDAVVDEAVQTINDNALKTVVQKIEANTWMDSSTAGVKSFFAMHRKFANLIRQMDGFKDGGKLWDIFVRPINEAASTEAAMREKATMALHELFKPILKAGGIKTKLYIPEINRSLSLEGRLSIALNLGNETNLRRIMDGEGWSFDQVNAIVKSLNSEQWNFVQGVWNYINSYWSEIAAKERRVSGVVPEKVEARPFAVTSSDGKRIELAGGYYPIKYNPDRSSRSMADEAAEIKKQMERGLYARAATRQGHTKARVESVKRALRYDFGVIFQHVDQVIHDLSWHETLIDINRLLRSGRIDGALRNHYGSEVIKSMRKTIEDVTIGEIGAQNVFEAAINHVRTGATIAGLGWNLTTSFLQPIGLTQSMARIGVKWVAKGATRWLRDAASMDNTVTWIGEKSEFMRLRAKTQQREINEIRNTINKGGVLTAVEESFFYFIGKMQLVADVPTWLGMYEKAMANGHDEPKAIAMADQAVLDSQGGGQVKDLAQIQRGSPLMKLWTNFYSFFNVTYNQLVDSINETRLVGASRLPMLAVDVLLLTTLPATLAFLMKNALKGGEDKDDEKLAKELVNENLGYMLGMMVGVREIGSMIQGTYGYNGAAGTRFFSDMGKLVKQAQQGEVDEALLKALNNVMGSLFHYPAGQVQRTVTGIQGLADGTTDNWLAPIVGLPPKQ